MNGGCGVKIMEPPMKDPQRKGQQDIIQASTMPKRKHQYDKRFQLLASVLGLLDSNKVCQS